MRFSVSALLGLVTLLGICASALVGSNEITHRMMTSVVFLCAIVATSIALFGARSQRAFALGFLVASLPYLYLTQPYRRFDNSFLVTDTILEWTDALLKFSQERRTPAGETVFIREDGLVQINTFTGRSFKHPRDAERMGYMKYAYRPGQRPSRQHFMAIGHLIAAIIIGGGNGVLSTWLDRRNSTRLTPATSDSTGKESPS